MTLATTKLWARAGAAGLLGAVALLASSCSGDEVMGAERVHVQGPSLGLHHPNGGFGGTCAEGCPCAHDGRGFCGVCHLFQQCVYCPKDDFCPKDPCVATCPTSNHGAGTSKCPSGFPNDCGDGTCCPNDHPQCCGDQRCATREGTCD